MNAQEKYEYWLDSAQYDFETATVMYSGRRWLYVAFMCQQAIEKLVKGLYVLYIDDNVPRTHNISFLVQTFEDKLLESVTDKHYDLFRKLHTFYINGRYTDYKQKINASLDKQEATDILKETREVFAWLLTLKP